MPAKNKQRHKTKQAEQIQIMGEEQQQQQQISQHIVIKDESKIEISSAQAELYFEYLRKKISHQTNDPFSLPFLNLKFQQLQSWKGATQQLNLQSRIYGMRVDNCHDYTMKLLNHVIRNQEQQIGKVIELNESQLKNDQISNHRQSMKNDFNFHLEKPQKIVCDIQLDKNLHNRSLWKMIFKKSETLTEIQLNKLQLSNNLRLQIDQRNVNWCKKQSKLQQNTSKGDTFEELEQILNKYLSYQHKPLIFQQIHNIKQKINEEVDQIIQKNKNKTSNNQQQLQQVLYDQQFGYKDLNFDDLYQQFNEFTKFQQDARVIKESQQFNSSFQEQSRQDVFAPDTKELFQIPIEHLQLMDSQIQLPQILLSEQDSEREDLYEPQKDILFHSTIKKARNSKRMDNRKFGKKRKNDNTIIDFHHPSLIMDRKIVFKHKKQQKNNLRNDNLIPINYVVVYGNRNPFKKPKKTAPKVSIYENINNEAFFLTNQPDNYHQSLNEVNLSQSIQPAFPFNLAVNQFNSQNHNEGNNNFEIQKHYLSVSMKTVKNEIKKEFLNNEGTSMLISKQNSRVSNHSESLLFDESSLLPSYLDEEAKMIGLKFLKQKMKHYDPLDILMSMLHVAYQEQVFLQPIYEFAQGSKDENSKRLHDIVIQGLDIHLH